MADSKAPHEATTLDEASANGDGTYNGYKAMQWMYHAVTGKVLTDEEAKEIGEKAKAIAAERRTHG